MLSVVNAIYVRGWTRHLDLSSNQLFGTAPLSLSSLSPRVQSSNLLLSNNQLTAVPGAVAAAYPVSGASWINNCITGATTTYNGCDLAERPALVELFVSTSATTARPGWTTSTNWLTSVHPCSWWGITCNGVSTVSAIILSSNGLVGTLPSSFSLATALTYDNAVGTHGRVNFTLLVNHTLTGKLAMIVMPLCWLFLNCLVIRWLG